MKYDDFINNVRDAASMESREEAHKASAATIKTLASHLSTGEAQDLASQLPEPLKHEVASIDATRQQFSVEDFFQRAQREMGKSDRTEAERNARAVVGVMSESITKGELEDVFSQLPKDFNELFTAKSV
jgi:uncharacterized protein (DUF2267 family)